MSCSCQKIGCPTRNPPPILGFTSCIGLHIRPLLVKYVYSGAISETDQAAYEKCFHEFSGGKMKA